jgi:hypothetical protein
MNLHRVESQLSSLERLVPHLSQHGCDISAQDAARALIHYFDDAPSGREIEDDLLKNEHKALGSAYAQLRGRLKDIADGRSGMLPVEQVAAFTRFYREHMLRAESVLIRPVTISPAANQLDG